MTDAIDSHSRIPPRTQLQKNLARVGVVIPTYNAARYWPKLQSMLDRQGVASDQILIIDSSSTDGTPLLASRAGYRVVSILRSEFSHGGTRQRGCDIFADVELLIFLTQDALPADQNSFRNICEVFCDPKVGAACGRQLPREHANEIEQHARFFNYPQVSSTRSYEDRKELGIKAAFLSNSFACYRRTALFEAGGFPDTVIIGEDSVVAARMLIRGWKIAYAAEAKVIHSHGYLLWEEFRRYFDTGVHHSRESWIRKSFGEIEGEGKRFFFSELSFLWKKRARLIPIAAARTALKLIAFKIGIRERYLPVRLSKKLSLQPQFWIQRSR